MHWYFRLKVQQRKFIAIKSENYCNKYRHAFRKFYIKISSSHDRLTVLLVFSSHFHPSHSLLTKTNQLFITFQSTSTSQTWFLRKLSRQTFNKKIPTLTIFHLRTVSRFSNSHLHVNSSRRKKVPSRRGSNYEQLSFKCHITIRRRLRDNCLSRKWNAYSRRERE